MINRLPRWVLYGSALLAFSAGFINCVALLGFANMAVSHVTGTVTLTAAALIKGDWSRLGLGLWIVLAFFVGSIISGMIIRNEALRLGRRYSLALVLESLLLFAATGCFFYQSLWGELLASAACGLQNAMIATYSGSVIRTTHLTGIVSDLGAAIGNYLSGQGFDAKQFQLQSSIFLAFFIGSGVGAVFYLWIAYWALLIPAVLVLIAAAAYWWVMVFHVLLDESN
jgi:uncharacterized membrane protein YoaK (UPF0700 family)